VRRGTGGFTLIEVLVALAIVTIGMAAVLEALTSSARTAMYLENKTFAEWVALDQMERVRLLSGNLPALGTSDGTIEMAHRRWQWRQKVVDSQVPGVRRITIDARPDSDKNRKHDWYATVIGVYGNSVGPPNPADPVWIQQPMNGPPTGGPGGTPSSSTPVPMSPVPAGPPPP
jgi:general secretion pathway protein I